MTGCYFIYTTMAGNADDLQANRLVHNDTCLLFWSTFRKHLLRTYAYSSTLQTSLDKGGLSVIGPNKMGTKKSDNLSIVASWRISGSNR